MLWHHAAIICMTFDRNTPPYYFAVSKDVEDHCPTELDGKTLSALDFIPTRARVKDTGYDVRCAEPDGLILKPNCYFKMRLGFRMFAPEGWWMSLAPRSGTFINNHVHALYGIIDQTYSAEMTFVGQFVPDECQLISASQQIIIPFGQRFAQVLPVPRWEMEANKISNEMYDKLCQERNDLRGTGGYGSSGRV